MARLPNAGQKTIPLDEWKRFVRVADWWDREYGHQTGPAAKATLIDLPSIVTIKNSSGSDQRRGDVLGLKMTSLLTETPVRRERIWLDADKLTNLDRNCLLVACLKEIKSGDHGLAQLLGATVAYVNVQATWHRRAYPAASSDVLYSGLFGPVELLVTPAGTGEALCYVRLGHADNRGLFAKTTSSIAKATLSSGRLVLGSGTATIYDPYATTAGQYEDASHPATIYNMAGDAVESGGFVRVTPTDDWLPLVDIDPCTQPT